LECSGAYRMAVHTSKIHIGRPHMNSANLIGAVAALYLREKSTQTEEESTGTARST
jgi:hypothetical protein